MATPRFLVTSAAAALVVQSFSFLNAPSHVATQVSNTLGFALTAAAAQTVYRPPMRPRPTERTATTGSRGCYGKSQPVLLSLLVPERHVGQTISARPSFLWYLENASVAKFALVEQGVPKPLFEQTIAADKAGIMQVDLPKTAPELAVGKEYRWSVTVACNTKRPSDYVAYNQSFIERVATPAELPKQLKAAKTDLEKARVYSQAGLWYDSLASLSQASRKDPSARNEMYSLLNQVGLNDVISQVRKTEQAANLR